MQYFLPLLISLAIPAFFVYVFCIVRPPTAPKALAENGIKKVLLVTAHPDDECMFFGPALLKLQASTEVHVLCLSKGNHDKLGEIREKELVKSCVALGVKPENVHSLDHPELPDHPTKIWHAAVVAKTVEDYVTKNNINMLLTFDTYGISGHTNHIATYFGIRHMLASSAKYNFDNLPTYTLTTVPLVRKYITFIDILFSISSLFQETDGIPQTLAFVSSPKEVMTSRKAMTCHRSQLVWFRQLYIIFSRYMFVNVLEKLEK
ncbi:LmbE-like protein [Basidiobolus meristosporus CBS 931.73]|uniref:N-acetylglucosaminylphosphatidylinositol deacetylase n=1 Tax=Basidiobolus meristosporus CBS 931.73 TaxID=1314790 RepID=A0A1Y1XYW6_9FUNG|nr:LmbE-like protein [Basidiobolus meristosporus CBS 931.73]|eukprot:ORX90931.1 LmbE-like protein [Basidiobolus meristosporus CBS 931.73]